MANGQSNIQAVRQDPMLSAFQAMAQQNQSDSQPASAASTSDPMLDAFKALKDNPDAQDVKKAPWSPNPDDSVAEIQTSDGNRHLIHADDLAEAQRRDKNLKVLSQPQTYQDYARGRTLQNMTRAMSGQPMERPEDQAEAERGRRAGTIAGGTQIGLGILTPALGFLGIGAEAAPEAKQVGTGLYDEFGREIFKDVEPEAKHAAWKVIQHPVVQKAIKRVVKGLIGEEVGRRLGGSIAGTGGSIAGGIGGAYLSGKVLSWLLSE